MNDEGSLEASDASRQLPYNRVKRSQPVEGKQVAVDSSAVFQQIIVVQLFPDQHDRFFERSGNVVIVHLVIPPEAAWRNFKMDVQRVQIQLYFQVRFFDDLVKLSDKRVGGFQKPVQAH